jgi:hypothetical protein
MHYIKLDASRQHRNAAIFLDIAFDEILPPFCYRLAINSWGVAKVGILAAQSTGTTAVAVYRLSA